MSGSIRIILSRDSRAGSPANRPQSGNDGRKALDHAYHVTVKQETLVTGNFGE